ncbi:MAG TPA: uracil-DNA glycosylase [Myxococcota bacterium]|nr:uracil-DNA glycosylase [Myxococcota bacterium]
MSLPPDWAGPLGPALARPSYVRLQEFVAEERKKGPVYPPEEEVYTAFALCPFAQTRVLLLGQDPYHGPGQAHGLSFSVKPGVPAPPSLANMYKELRDDQGIPIPRQGSLVPWARQGVLLLNAVLTVRDSEPASHAKKGWEDFTDAVIRLLNARPEPVVFALWGGYARKKVKLIDGPQHRVLEGVHPSPLSAHGGFFGSRPYSRINAALAEVGQTPIDWTL